MNNKITISEYLQTNELAVGQAIFKSNGDYLGIFLKWAVQPALKDNTINVQTEFDVVPMHIEIAQVEK